MKLNKFVCGCEHEFYDSNSVSVCDACGRTVYLKAPKTDASIDIRLVEALQTNGNRIRNAIEIISETATTHKKSNGM